MRRTAIIKAAVVALLAAPAWSSPDGRELRRTPVVEVVERVRDSIVNISATGLVKYERRSPFFDLWPMPPIDILISRTIILGTTTQCLKFSLRRPFSPNME